MRRTRVGSVSSRPATSAAISNGRGLIGSTRPTAPTIRATVSSATTGSPSVSASPASMRLPTGWPASAPVPPKRCCSSPAQVRPQSSSPASAASAIRRSPGGSTPSSRRSRPDEPPSSATVTTAVTYGVRRRSAARDAARPWPPPRATTRGPSGGTTPAGLLTPQVPVRDRGLHPVADQPLGDLLGHRDRPVLAAGAADRQRQVALALPLVAGADQPQQLGVDVEEAAGALLGEHV